MELIAGFILLAVGEGGDAFGRSVVGGRVVVVEGEGTKAPTRVYTGTLDLVHIGVAWTLDLYYRHEVRARRALPHVAATQASLINHTHARKAADTQARTLTTRTTTSHARARARARHRMCGIGSVSNLSRLAMLFVSRRTRCKRMRGSPRSHSA